MGRADETGRDAFRAILVAIQAAGATVELTVNGQNILVESELLWSISWKTLGIVLRKGQLPLGIGGKDSDTSLIAEWASRFAACLVALLPLEVVGEDREAGAQGLPEGALARIEVNRYERDRRNRAAALAIHGFSCAACGVKLSDIYGEIASNFIEVHHVTPVSEIGENYRINPATDLVPLCPNCHAVIHHSARILTVGDLKKRLAIGGA